MDELSQRAVPSTVTEVTLYEDRALVTRAFDVVEGRQELVLGPLSALVSEQRLSYPSGNLQVEGVRVVREQVPREAADPETFGAAAAALDHAERRAREAELAVERARERLARIEQASAAAVSATGRAFLEEQEPGRWVAAVAALAARSTPAHVALADAEAASARAEAEVGVRRAALDELRAGRPVWRAWLVLRVVATGTRSELRYVVPCAVWRPAHAASVDTTTGRLTWELRAFCWNATGEDWRGVQLSCSTARPGDLGNPPALVDDVVRARRRPEVEVEVREEEIRVARGGGGRRTPELPGVEDGGEPRSYRADGRVDLPSTGQPVGVVLDRFTTDATLSWVAAPELGAVAVRRCVARNVGPRPLLAGPVALTRDGVWVGRGRIDFVGAGEPVVIGLGSLDGLRITRRSEQKVSATVTGRQLRTTLVELRVAHLGDAACRLRIDERVPVSDLKEVSVSAPKAEPALDGPVDRDGAVRWTLELVPGDVRTLTLEYTIDAASQVRLPGHA